MVTRGALFAALDMARCPFCVLSMERKRDRDPAETISTRRHGNTISACMQPRTRGQAARRKCADALRLRAYIHPRRMLQNDTSCSFIISAGFIVLRVCSRVCSVYSTLGKLRVALAVALHVASSCSLRVPTLSPSHTRTHASTIPLAQNARAHKLHAKRTQALTRRTRSHTSPQHSCPAPFCNLQRVINEVRGCGRACSCGFLLALQ
jgi:hypothetical protein